MRCARAVRGRSPESLEVTGSKREEVLKEGIVQRDEVRSRTRSAKCIDRSPKALHRV
jgi:hypothetical protein